MKKTEGQKMGYLTRTKVSFNKSQKGVTVKSVCFVYEGLQVEILYMDESGTWGIIIEGDVDQYGEFDFVSLEKAMEFVIESIDDNLGDNFVPYK